MEELKMTTRIGEERKGGDISKEGQGAEEEEEVDGGVEVQRMDAMQSQVGGIQVVEQVVDRCHCHAAKVQRVRNHEQHQHPTCHCRSS